MSKLKILNRDDTKLTMNKKDLIKEESFKYTDFDKFISRAEKEILALEEVKKAVVSSLRNIAEPMYITPNGTIIDVAKYLEDKVRQKYIMHSEFSNDVFYNQLKYEGIIQIDPSKITNPGDYLEHVSGFIRLNNGSAVTDSRQYFVLDAIHRPTSKQYSLITEFLDMNSRSGEIIIYLVSRGGTETIYYNPRYKVNSETVDELIKRIKRWFTTGVLVEKTEDELREEAEIVEQEIARINAEEDFLCRLTKDVPEWSAYILPDGRYLELRMEPDTDLYPGDNGSLAHRGFEAALDDHSSPLRDIIRRSLRVNDGTNPRDLLYPYVELTQNRPNEIQEKSLLRWFDKIWRIHKKIEVITPTKGGDLHSTPYKTYDTSSLISDDLLKKIRRWYSSGLLVESIGTAKEKAILDELDRLFGQEEVYMWSTYILPNGHFLSPYNASKDFYEDDFDYYGPTYEHQDFEINVEDDKGNEIASVYETVVVLDRRAIKINVTYPYIAFPSSRPTSEQLQSVRKVIQNKEHLTDEAVWDTIKELNLSINDFNQPLLILTRDKEKIVDLSYESANDIIKTVNRFYSVGMLENKEEDVDISSIKSLLQHIKDMFGRDDFNIRAPFILDDGTILGFTESQSHEYGSGYAEHGDIITYLNSLGVDDFSESETNISKFLYDHANAIRLFGGGLELSKEMPSAKQFKMLREWLKGQAEIEISSKKEYAVYNLEDVSIDYVIGRIKRHYNTGKLLEKLTKEQEQYFKNSKVRDKKGNLLVVYHGTHSPGFLEFNPVNKDSKFGEYKFKDAVVNYFTSDMFTAQGYTELGVGDEYGKEDALYGNIYTCYLNIENPYYVDNSSTAELKTWQNIKDKSVRDRELKEFDRFYNKWEYIADREDLDDINRELYQFGVTLRPSKDDEDYFDLVRTGNNTAYGRNFILMYAYEIEELFGGDYYEELRDNIVGEVEDDYFYTIDDIVRWILLQNAEEGTNYDGVIVEDVRDIGPKGSPFFTDVSSIYVTLKSSNQIKLINNVNPTTSSKINEEDTLEESKQDVERFTKWAGKELADRYFKQKSKMKPPYNDITWVMKNYVNKEDFEEDVYYYEQIPTRGDINKKGKEGAKLIYSDKNWKVYKIDTYEAAVKYGKNTQWCLTGTNTSDGDDISAGREHYNKYVEDGYELYFYIYNKNNDKYALIYANDNDWQLFDSADFLEVCSNMSSPPMDTWNPQDTQGYHPDFPKVKGLPDINKVYDDYAKEMGIFDDTDIDNIINEAVNESRENINEPTYNAGGITKSIQRSFSTAKLENINFDYDGRGWITSTGEIISTNNAPHYEKEHKIKNSENHVKYNFGYERYIGLPENRLSFAQYETLTKLLDYFFVNKSNVGIRGNAIEINYDMNDKGDFKWKLFSPKTHTTDDIIKLIKRYYTTGRLNESSNNKMYKKATHVRFINKNEYDTLQKNGKITPINTGMRWSGKKAIFTFPLSEYSLEEYFDISHYLNDAFSTDYSYAVLLHINENIKPILAEYDVQEVEEILDKELQFDVTNDGSSYLVPEVRLTHYSKDNVVDIKRISEIKLTESNDDVHKEMDNIITRWQAGDLSNDEYRTQMQKLQSTLKKEKSEEHEEDTLEEAKEDIERFERWAGEELAQRFFRLKDRLKGQEKDIYYWMKQDKEELDNTLSNLEDSFTRKDLEQQAKEGAEIVHQDSTWTVYKINTAEASCKYGKNTAWCISGSDAGSYFHDKSRYYFYINKKDRDKYALQIYPDGQYIIWTAWDAMTPFIKNGPAVEGLPKVSELNPDFVRDLKDININASDIKDIRNSTEEESEYWLDNTALSGFIILTMKNNSEKYIAIYHLGGVSDETEEFLKWQKEFEDDELEEDLRRLESLEHVRDDEELYHIFDVTINSWKNGEITDKEYRTKMAEIRERKKQLITKSVEKDIETKIDTNEVFYRYEIDGKDAFFQAIDNVIEEIESSEEYISTNGFLNDYEKQDALDDLDREFNELGDNLKVPEDVDLYGDKFGNNIYRSAFSEKGHEKFKGHLMAIKNDLDVFGYKLNVYEVKPKTIVYEDELQIIYTSGDVKQVESLKNNKTNK